MLGKHCLDVLVDVVWGVQARQLGGLVDEIKVVDDGHRLGLKHLEPLLDGLEVVVGPARRLATIEQAFQHGALGAVEEQRELGRHDGVLERQGLVHLAGEPVDQKVVDALVDVLLHGVPQQGHRDLLGHDLARFDVVGDQLAVGRALALLLGPQQVSGTKVHKVVVPDDVCALRALSRTRAPEHEHHEDVVGAEGASQLLGLLLDLLVLLLGHFTLSAGALLAANPHCERTSGYQSNEHKVAELGVLGRLLDVGRVITHKALPKQRGPDRLDGAKHSRGCESQATKHYKDRVSAGTCRVALGSRRRTILEYTIL